MGIKAVIIPENNPEGIIKVTLIDIETGDILITLPVDNDFFISLAEDKFIDYNYSINLNLKVDEVELC